MAAPVLADPIGAMEDALIARCREVLAVGDGRSLVRTVQALPADWDDEMLSTLLREVPGVFVAFGGGPALDGNFAEVEARWLVYVATGHETGQEARRRGDAFEVGAYQLLALLAPALHGWAPDEASTLQLVSVDNLFTGTIERKGVAVYGLTLKGPMGLDATEPPDLSPFVTFDASIDIPEHQPRAVHEAWMAGDANAPKPDAAVKVTLEQP